MSAQSLKIRLKKFENRWRQRCNIIIEGSDSVAHLNNMKDNPMEQTIMIKFDKNK